RIVEPGSAFEATIRTRDANGEPLAVDGSAVLLRVTELTDAQFAARYGADALPSPEQPREVEQEVERVAIATELDGEVDWRPRVEREGAYRVRFEAADVRSGARVRGEATGYAADESTRSLQVTSDGIQLLLDEDKLGEGEPATAILLSDRTGRPVLFTSASNGRVDVQVVRMQGIAKLVRVDLLQRHVPQVTLRARAVGEGRLLEDSAELTVVPTQRVLNIETELSGEVYAPGDEATVQVRVTDAAGQPVESELSLSVFDQAVTAIRAESTTDPRAWFYGKPVRFQESTGSSFGFRGYGEYTWAELEGSDGDVGEQALLGRRQYEQLRSLGYVDGDALAGSSTFNSSGRGVFLLDDAPAAEGLIMNSVASRDEAPKSGPGAAPVNTRTDFRETATWSPSLRTDANGQARVDFTFPDSTTNWRLTAVANDGGSRFGIERRDAARTTLPLLLRLATPRFLVDRDEALFSTLVRNDTDGPLAATVKLALEGAELLGLVGEGGPLVELAAGEERTLDWRVRTAGAGQVRVVASVAAGEFADGIERRLPVLEHGVDVQVTASGALDGERSTLTLDLPPAKPGTTDVTVTVAPSLAATAIEALPFLADYPYGCLEQTLSRFVPTAVTLDALTRLGFERGDVANAAFARPTQRRPAPDSEQTLAQIDAMAEAGLARVLSMQRGDGGFSWWPGGKADVLMSGYAVWSLSLAHGAGLDVPRGAIERGRSYLSGELTATAERDLDLAAWCLHAIAAANETLETTSIEEVVLLRFTEVFEAREGLGAYGRALLLLTAHSMGFDQQTAVLLRNIEDGVVIEDGPGGGLVQPDAQTVGRTTAHWGEDGIGYRWSQDGVEATAFSVRALLAVDPEHALIEPAIEWLVLNRRGAAWKSTRDTAVCVLALVDAVVQRGELELDTSFTLTVDGVERGGGVARSGVAALVPAVWSLGDLEPGMHRLTLERTRGEGRLYWSALAETFSVADRIRPRSNEIAVRRDVQHLAGRETLLAGTLFERRPLAQGATVPSGDRVEVVLTFETRVPLEYIAIEGWKPAGFEAVDSTSGYGSRLRELRADEVERRFGQGLNALETVGDALPTATAGYTGRSVGAYRELRDDRVLHFVNRLPAGVWELRTTLRAETPGTFAALPTVAHA
ncbi:MAG: alpha-2-macroglobulin family protein, partial [Planctomycetota bacterium]